MTADDLLDPREGELNNEADRAALEPVLKKIALDFLEYEEDGATCWDTMIDVRSRPPWLKELGELAMVEDAEQGVIFRRFRKDTSDAEGKAQVEHMPVWLFSHGSRERVAPNGAGVSAGESELPPVSNIGENTPVVEMYGVMYPSLHPIP